MKWPYPRIFLTTLLVLSFLPVIQQLFHPFKLAGLQGAYDPGPAPRLTAHAWTAGTFQHQADQFVKFNTGFNGELVRLRNQLYYSLFDEINTNLTLGRDRYLFDLNYQLALEGNDFMPDSTRRKKTETLHEATALLQELGIPLIVGFAPNKARYFQEYLPHAPKKAGADNRTWCKAQLRQNGVAFIDFDDWFYEAKDTASWPLMVKYGAHWSTYGAALAFDSLLKVMQTVSGLPLSHYRIDRIETTTRARFTDDDYLPSLNLMEKWESPVLAYPTLKFHSEAQPDVLIIGDSFIWNLYDLEIVEHAFGDETTALYYFKTVYDARRHAKGPVPPFRAADLKKFKIILLISSDPSNANFGFGFLELLAQLKVS